MKLQVNTAGAWKDVVQFDAAYREEVIAAARALEEAAHDDVKWCVVDDAGKREWL